MYRNLREYVARLDRAGELARIAVRVDPEYEIAEITDRMSKSPGGGKALLFEDTGTPFPVLTNLYGSERRCAMALGAESLDAVAARIGALLREAAGPRDSLFDKLRTLPLLAEIDRKSTRLNSSH